MTYRYGLGGESMPRFKHKKITVDEAIQKDAIARSKGDLNG